MPQSPDMTEERQRERERERETREESFCTLSLLVSGLSKIRLRSRTGNDVRSEHSENYRSPTDINNFSAAIFSTNTKTALGSGPES